MNLNKTLLSFLFCILIWNCNAQILIDNNFNTSKIDTLRYNRKNEKFYLGEKKMYPSDLKPILSRFNSTAVEFNKYQKMRTPAMIILFTGMTSGVIAMTRLKKDKNFFNPFTITLFAGDLIGIPLIISARKHLQKAATLYNKEIREF